MTEPVPGVRTTVQGDSARQVELYGEPWSIRLTRLLHGYRLSQAKLGAVIGLSAPMVSQLMSGQRVKISNPAVFGRVVRLEENLTRPGVAAGDTAAIEAALADVAAAAPLTTLGLPTSELAGTATADQFRQVADAARAVGAEKLAAVLDRAAGP